MSEKRCVVFIINETKYVWLD